MLRRYMYLSHATLPLTEDELRPLIHAAEQANQRHGVTGLLIYADGHFMQLVEGPPEAIGQLKANIEADTRHTGITQLRDGPGNVRLFDDWSLACNLPGDGTSLSLKVAKELSHVDWNNDDLELLSMLARFWSDFGTHFSLNEANQPRWNESVLRS